MTTNKNLNLEVFSSPEFGQMRILAENGNLIKTVTGGNGTYKYTYDSTYKHRLTSVTNDLITQSVTYDSAGNAITTKLTGSGSKTISTAASYEGGLNRLASVTDAAGMKLTYGFGTKNAQMLALPTSITDPNGTVSYTSYDTNFRVSKQVLKMLLICCILIVMVIWTQLRELIMPQLSKFIALLTMRLET